MQEASSKGFKSRVLVLLITLTFVSTYFSPLMASTDEEIIILKNKIAELEKRDIENRVILTDIKELLAAMTLEIAALKEKIAKQDELLSAIPRRVPRPVETLEVEDTTPSEVPIDTKPNSSSSIPAASSTKSSNATVPKQDSPASDTKKAQTGSASSILPDRKPAIDTPEEDANIEPSGDKKNLYNSASKFYSTGAIDKAHTKFKEYIDKYPDDDLTDNAQYWIGECNLKKGEYLKAIEEFQKVIEYYPLGNKVPDAYLKIGYSYLYLKDNVSALQYFNLVRDMFPHTDASIEAEKKIKELSKR